MTKVHDVVNNVKETGESFLSDLSNIKEELGTLSDTLKTKFGDVSDKLGSIEENLDSLKNNLILSDEKRQEKINQINEAISKGKNTLDELKSEISGFVGDNELKNKLEQELNKVKEKLKEHEKAIKNITFSEDGNKKGKIATFFSSIGGRFKDKRQKVGNWFEANKNRYNELDESQKQKIKTGGWIALGATGGILLWKKLKKRFSKEEREKRKAERKERKEKKKAEKAEKKSKEMEEEQEEEETSDDGGKKKKSFRDKPIGKALKWTGIGAGVIRLLKQFGFEGIKSGDATDSSKKQVNETLELQESDPEKFEKYKKLGENIDNQYNQVMQKEIAAGWGGTSIADGYEEYADKNNIDKDIFQATVPMCIDNTFKSVDDIISESGYYAYLRGLKFSDLKNEILNWGNEKISKLLGPFLMKLTSFIPFNKGKDWEKSVRDWLDSDPPTQREAELQWFFRQYAKVVNYVQDKGFSLMEKIAEGKMATVGADFSTVGDALQDNKFVEDHIKTDPRYKNFINGKLSIAVNVLEENGIFDSKLSEDMQNVVKAQDEERDDILKRPNGEDAINNLPVDASDLTIENRTESSKTCDKLLKDIDDNFDKTRRYMYFSCFDVATNSDQNNLQEFLKYAGLDKAKAVLIEDLQLYKQKFKDGTITSEEINLYKNEVNSYFAMLKEVYIGAKAIQQIKSDNSNYLERAWNTAMAAGKDFISQTGASFEHFKKIGDYETLGGKVKEFGAGWFYATLPIFVGGKLISGIGGKVIPGAEIVGDFISKLNVVSVGRLTAEQVVMRVGGYFNYWPNRLLKARYNHPQGAQHLMQDLIEGNINGKTADNFIRNAGLFEDVNLEKFVQRMLSTGAATNVMPAERVNLLFDSDINFLKNESLRKLFFGEPQLDKIDFGKWGLKGFRKKMYKLDSIDNFTVIEQFMNGGINSKHAKMSKEQKLLFKKIAEGGNFDSVDTLKALTANIEKVSINGLETKKIEEIAAEICKNSDNIKNESKFIDLVSFPGRSAEDIASIKPVLKELENEKNVLKSAKSIPNLEDAKITHIDNMIAHFDELEVEIKNMNKVKLEKFSELWKLIKEANVAKELPDILEQFKTLEKFSKATDVNGQKIAGSIDDILKLDIDELRKLKGGKIADLSDDAIESVAKTLHHIKTNKNVLKNSDDIIDGLKLLVKVFAKVS